MTNIEVQEREQAQHEQEKACADTFMEWLTVESNHSYELRKAEEVFPELRGHLRWEFVARVKGRQDWLALEVKALVVPDWKRQINDWSAFCIRATQQLQGKLQGEFGIMPSIPWSFSQAAGRTLVTTFGAALFETAPNLDVDDLGNLGPRIAELFPEWPKKKSASSPRIDWNTGRVVYDPEDLWITKLKDTGCCVEIGSSVGQLIDVDPTLYQAVNRIFQPRGGKSAKPNEQLGLAKEMGAVSTFLLLDSHVADRPNIVRQALSQIDKTLLSSIDNVYLVSVSGSHIEDVWH